MACGIGARRSDVGSRSEHPADPCGFRPAACATVVGTGARRPPRRGTARLGLAPAIRPGSGAPIHRLETALRLVLSRPFEHELGTRGPVPSTPERGVVLIRPRFVHLDTRVV